MKKLLALAAAVVLLAISTAAQADVFNLGPGLTNLETVPVGDPGNVPDTRDETPGYGAVSYTYNIGKYEVTAAQYTDFLNSKAKSDRYGLYNTSMSDPTWYNWGCNIQRSGNEGNYSYTVAPDWANRPVNHVSFWDACRFANWLNNGQGDGDTETGAYILNGYIGQDGRTIGRNGGAGWVLPSEDEWYKAAYYKGGGSTAGYWDYPTQSDSVPSNDLVSPDPGNNATYHDTGNYDVAGFTIGSPYYRTEAGAHESSESTYGTFDQGGNVWEWNDSIVCQDSDYAYRGLRSGSFYDCAAGFRAGFRTTVGYPANYGYGYGFRIAYIPEPSSFLVLLGGIGVLLGVRRRR